MDGFSKMMMSECMYRVEEPDESREADAVMKAAQDQMTGNPIQVFMPIIRNMVSPSNECDLLLSRAEAIPPDSPSLL